MKKLKLISAILAIAIVVLITGQPVARAGENLEFWPVNTYAVGKSFWGRIVLIMQETSGNTCSDNYATDVTIEAYLTLYDKPISWVLSKTEAESWNFKDADTTTYCYPTDLEDGIQAALVNFLEEVVRPKLKRRNDYDEIFLKEVTNEYESFSNNTGPTYIVVADVEIVAK